MLETRKLQARAAEARQKMYNLLKQRTESQYAIGACTNACTNTCINTCAADSACNACVTCINAQIPALLQQESADLAAADPAAARARPLHGAAQRTHIGDLPEEVYKYIFTHRARAICRRIYRWVATIPGIMCCPRRHDSLEHIRKFLDNNPHVILDKRHTKINTAPELAHKYVYVGYQSCPSARGATHIMFHNGSVGDLAILGKPNANAVKYIRILQRWNYDAIPTYLSAGRLLRMTQESYDNAKYSGIIFIDGVEIVPSCEMHYVPKK